MRGGLEGLRAGFATLARAARSAGRLDFIQYAVYGDRVDADAYTRAAVTLIDGAGGAS